MLLWRPAVFAPRQLDPQPANLPEESGLVDSQLPGGLQAIPLIAEECSGDQLLLVLLHEADRAARGEGELPLDLFRQVYRPDRLTGTEDHGMLDDVFQLPDTPRVVM